jgi:hypothetical protein
MALKALPHDGKKGNKMNPLDQLNRTLKSSAPTITKREYIIREVGIIASTIKSAGYLSNNELNEEAYVRTLEPLTVAQLKLAFAQALRKYGAKGFVPTPLEIRAESGYREAPASSTERLSGEELNKLRAVKSHEVVARCFIEENRVLGSPLGRYKDPMELLSLPDMWAPVDPQGRGYIVIRTHGKDYIGYEVFNAALAAGELVPGPHILFLTLPTGAIIWTPVFIKKSQVFSKNLKIYHILYFGT